MRKPRKFTVVASRSAEAVLAEGVDDSNFATTLAKGPAVLERGVNMSDGDWIATIQAVVVPAFRARGTGDYFAINCGVPAFRLRPGQLEGEIAPRFITLAANIRSIAGEDVPKLYAPAPADAPTIGGARG